MRKLTLNLIIAVAMVVVLALGAHAASITDLYVTPQPEGAEGDDVPGEGTSNSIFTIQFNWHQEDGRFPDANSLELCVYTPYVGSTCYRLPHNAGRGNPASGEGRLYEFRMTAGVNLANEGIPGTFNPGHPIPDMVDVFYIPILKAGPDGAANQITLLVRARYTDPTEEDAEPELIEESTDVIIHDSHPHSSDRYAGVSYDRDFLYAYYGYQTPGPYPINTYAINENFQWRNPDDPSTNQPDNGTTSTCYEFRVVYVNSDNLPPVPYLTEWGGPIGDDYIGLRTGEVDTGVVLYLRNKSWDPDADFIAIPMQKVNEGDTNYADGCEYFYAIEPQGRNAHVGLPIGEYEYFFGCSDDFIRTKGGAIPWWLDNDLIYSPLDILPKRALDLPITGATRSRHPVWYAFMSAYNMGLYLDRPTLQPGVSNSYYLLADRHPVVSVGLKHPDPSLSPWQCTVSPAYPMVNPQTGGVQMGGAENQKWDFLIMYQHLDGVTTPESSQGSGGEISVWINNSNTRTPNPTDPSTLYTRYTLRRDPDNALGTDIKEGILYNLDKPVQLSPGPHSYFFTTSDGRKRARYPVEGHFYEGTHAFTGPYVNHRPVLSNPLVDPPTGTAGDRFRYSVLYKDADNQRPFSAKIYIEYADGQVLVGEMVKQNPADSDYDGTGVRYIFDTANMAQQFQVGQRRFYFEFTDDWGAPNDPRDQRRGEAVYWNSVRPESWIYGPYINRNTPPQLFEGGVTATDGANNSATLFEYKVRYVDVDNHSPKYIDVYIGQMQSNGSISWDNGHRMDPVDPTDVIYGDGASFHYYSRLTGDAAGKNYYYCFVASDGYDVAEYDEIESPSSGTIWYTWSSADFFDPLRRILHKGERLSSGSGVFETTHKPIVGPIPNAPTYNPYRAPLVWSVVDGSELSYTSVSYVSGLVTVPSQTQIDLQYWFATAGPTGVTANNPPSLSQGRVSPDPGESINEYTYTVVYTDLDGTTGQAPYYIRVRIDGVAYDMMRASGQGEPDYKRGVTYYYRTSSLTPQLPHRYYFEASDGSGFAIFDNNGGRQSGEEIGAVVPIPGPYVNNKPTLTAPAGGAVNPIPGTPINESTWVNLSIIYTDANNEWPSSGYPVVYIRKVIAGQPTPPIAPEPANDFKVGSVNGNSITLLNLDDSTPSWTVDEFKGLPLQMTSGTLSGTSFKVTGNTASTLTVFATNLTGVAVGNTLSVGKIILSKADPSDTNCADGVLYEYRLNTLGIGDYALHFVTSTLETIGADPVLGKRTTVVRYPATGEITGLKVTSTAPVGNLAPVLTSGSAIPQVGRSGDLFTFRVTYSDANGHAPELREVDQVQGYVWLIIDDRRVAYIPMTGPPTPPAPNYVTGAVFTAVVDSASLAEGPHTYYFEASDGWVSTRLPAVGSAPLLFYINRKPVLTNPAVTPTSGNEGRQYIYTVTYTDPDSQSPASILVWIDGTSYAMTIDTSFGTNFAAGVRYRFAVQNPTILTPGAPDSHSFYFTASDGLESATPTTTIIGPYVYANVAPVLSSGMVNPVSRWTDSTYTYSVVYRDPNGDAPQFVKVYIDGSGDANAFLMTKVANQNDYTAGVTYTYNKVGLSRGDDHTFFFTANDYLLDARDPSTGTFIGPTVADRPTAFLQVNQPTTTPAIGQATTITGSVTPGMAITLMLEFTRPDGTSLLRSVTTNSSGAFSTVWTPNMTGMLPGPTWRVSASWTGNADYGPTESSEIVVQVSGPSTTVRGLDMISIPLNPANPFPGVVFGEGSYAVARWRPSLNDYAYYFSIQRPTPPNFPLADIELGYGYWVKVYESQTMNLAPSGDLASTSSNYLIYAATGWNQIGCPFTSRVDWSALRVRSVATGQTVDLATAASRGWVRAYGWAFQQSGSNPYTGEYKLVDPTKNGALRYLEPWRGYWFRALTPCYVVVPPPSTLAVEASRPMSVESVGGSDWEVGLSVSVEGKMDADNGFGSGQVASRIESPRYLDNYIDLSFTDDKGGSFAYDIRLNAAQGETWKFKVTTDQADGLAQIAWSGVGSMPIGRILMLVDETSGQRVLMTPGGVYTFPASDAVGGKLFSVTLGDQRPSKP